MSSIAEDPAVASVVPPAPAWAVDEEIHETAPFDDRPGQWIAVDRCGVERSAGAVSVQLEQTLAIHVPTRCVALDDVAVCLTVTEGPNHSTSVYVPLADVQELVAALAAVCREFLVYCDAHDLRGMPIAHVQNSTCVSPLTASVGVLTT